jgi:hypothetical protein
MVYVKFQSPRSPFARRADISTSGGPAIMKWFLYTDAFSKQWAQMEEGGFGSGSSDNK